MLPGTLTLRSGKPIEYDAVNLRITNHPEADLFLRTSLEIPRAFGWRDSRREEGGYPQRSRTEEPRSQTNSASPTLRTAGLWAATKAVPARGGDAPAGPPRPRPKPRAAEPDAIFRKALTPCDKHPRADSPRVPCPARWPDSRRYPTRGTERRIPPGLAAGRCRTGRL